LKYIVSYLLFSCLIVLFVGIILSSNLFAQNPTDKLRFVVTSVIDHTNNESWENQLIAYGIRNIVNSELYDTGKYIPVEDHPEITDQIDKLIATNWQGDLLANGVDDATQLAGDVADCTVQVTVHDFKVKRRRSIGLFAAAKTTIKISVDVELKNIDGSSIKVTGTGKGVTKSLGILFQIREDKVHFNETTVGQATQKAIHDAINKL